MSIVIKLWKFSQDLCMSWYEDRRQNWERRNKFPKNVKRLPRFPIALLD